MSLRIFLFDAEIGIDQILIVDETIISVPARFFGGIEKHRK
jgi:hypothetical protein